MGVITLEDLSVKTYIGVTERERSRKQKLLVSVEIECVRPAGGGPDDETSDDETSDEVPSEDDSIANTVDYSEVRAAIKELLEGSRYNLIETAAFRTALALRERFGRKGAGRISVMVKKFPYRDAKFAAYRCDLPPRG